MIHTRCCDDGLTLPDVILIIILAVSLLAWMLFEWKKMR